MNDQRVLGRVLAQEEIDAVAGAETTSVSLDSGTTEDNQNTGSTHPDRDRSPPYWDAR